MRRKLVLALIVAVAIASSVALSASADGPVAGTTYSTQCVFGQGSGADPGTTNCFQTIVRIIEGSCWSAESGMRLWEEDDISSVRSYRGNAVFPGLNGVLVNADYAGVVRAHAVLLSDSGAHALSSTFPVADPTCP